MNGVKCDCGHVNHVGTAICEACGKPLVEIEGDQLLDMRYDGVARRSTTYKQTMVDKIWNFFSSVKVGIWIIIITLVASAIGTIFPQENYLNTEKTLAEFYQDEYGVLGTIYYKLGFHDLYNSWWYLLLIGSLGASLVICSIDRVVPLYRALKNQRVTKHEGFLKRQRLFSVSKVGDMENEIEKVRQKLLKNRYRVRVENGDVLAEKGRFSRWGPYVNHVGLIIFLAGTMIRFIPGMYVDEVMWVREGETKEIPGTNGQYYLTNHTFAVETYDKDKEDEKFKEAIENAGNNTIPKNFQSDVTLERAQAHMIIGEEPKLSKVKDESIKVNEPLTFNGYSVYQVDYKLSELSKMSFYVEKKETGEKLGEMTIDLVNPKSTYQLDNGVKVKIINYFPDFQFNSNGEPSTKSKTPNNPAFVFTIYTKDTPEGEASFVAIQQNVEESGTNQYKMTFKGIETRNASAFTVRKDSTLWILGLGGAIFMIGVIQGMYWNHRRIWLQQKNGELWLAGYTNKNWYGFSREIETILAGTTISSPLDRLKES